jgi:hypothetical protein
MKLLNKRMYKSMKCCSNFLLITIFTLSLEYHGINYSDSYALEYPHYIKALPINRYVLQVKHFHRASYVKCSYHIVCTKMNSFYTLS